MLRDVFRFLLYNWQHYSLALWGLRLRIDPDYPLVTKFFPGLIADSVLEYRTYGGIALWAMLLAFFLPLPLGTALVVLWAVQSWDRSKHFQSNLTFWREASRENPFPHRAHARYVEQLIREAERLEKAGKSGEMALREAQTLMDKVCAAGALRTRP